MPSRKTNIIKWYEYTMKNEEADEENTETEAGNVPEDSTPTDIGQEGMEENTDYGDVDPALVEEIMAKFRDAKQSSVDDLFGNSSNASTEGAVEMSEEELIASICAPKQNNVDAFVKKANE